MSPKKKPAKRAKAAKPRPRAPKKTAAKTAGSAGMAVSPLNGAAIPLGAHPGNTGGKKGRSGRKPQKFKDFCNDLANDPEFLEGIRRDALAGDKDARKLVVEYAMGKPTQTIESRDLTLEQLLDEVEPEADDAR